MMDEMRPMPQGSLRERKASAFLFLFGPEEKKKENDAFNYVSKYSKCNREAGSGGCAAGLGR
jgi:hypothetical protein